MELIVIQQQPLKEKWAEMLLKSQSLQDEKNQQEAKNKEYESNLDMKSDQFKSAAERVYIKARKPEVEKKIEELTSSIGKIDAEIKGLETTIEHIDNEARKIAKQIDEINKGYTPSFTY